MKNWTIPIALIVVCLVAYLAARHHQRTNLSATGSRPGQLAPQFSTEDLSGRPINLTQYRGKVVLLNFWATWCEPCREEIPEFIRMQSNTPNLQIIGISLDDSEEPVHTFYKQFKMNYPVAIGDATLATRYGGVLGLPITFLIGCDGRVSTKHIGEVQISEITKETAMLLRSTTCS